jgi:hypothetical protein
MTVTIDHVQGLLTFTGFVASAVLLVICWRDWMRTHARWAYRATVMSAVVLMTWIGYAAAISTRIFPGLSLEVAQMVALGARTTLLAMVLWLIAIRGRDSAS